jgi:hypothetical protein
MNKTPLQEKLNNIINQLDLNELWAVVAHHPDVIDFHIISIETIKDEIENQIENYYDEIDESIDAADMKQKVDEYFEANKDELIPRAYHYLEEVMEDNYFAEHLNIEYKPNEKDK